MFGAMYRSRSTSADGDIWGVRMDIRQLAQKIDPERTVLLLGAGAAISSGAPTGLQLAQQLASNLDPKPAGDLSEIAGIWEYRLDRRSLADKVRSILLTLSPSHGMLTLPLFMWHSLYSTNFDQLVEKSYMAADRQLDVIRSNHDFRSPQADVPRLYKIHGCVSKDIAYGDAARMVLTERDYDLVAESRQAMFRAFAFDVTTCDTLVIGQSLTDRHLRDLAKEAARLNRESGTPGHIYMLSFSEEPDHAALLEQLGISVTSGSLEDFLYELGNRSPSRPAASSNSPIRGLLPASLAVTCIDVSHAKSLKSNPLKLFNGGAATYADVSDGLTVQRTNEVRLLNAQDSAHGFFTTIVGVAGVGKTSLARRVLFQRSTEGFECWEALDAYPLNAEHWLIVDSNLRKNAKQGFLLIDDATRMMSQVNKLVDALARLDRPHLRLILTANLGAWKSRRKSRGHFSRGSQISLGKMSESDLTAMINLVDREPKIAELVDPKFRLLNKAQQVSQLRVRCNSEMFVCLKNIFGSAELDYIILEEYAGLPDSEQEIYRHVAALQAMGARVHRQLVLRCLNVDASTLEAHLTLLDGIVDEDAIDAREGLYRWNVRHDVIAEVVAKYKFADPDRLKILLEDVIEGVNPAISMEIETIRSICTNAWGLERLPDYSVQINLLRRIIEILPSERIPRRRLIKRYLDLRELDEAGHEIRAARGILRSGDQIIDRYEVRALLYRAEDDSRLMEDDRIAILLDALTKSKKLVSTYSLDVHNLRALADVAVELARKTGNCAELDRANDLFAQAEEELLDPEISRIRSSYVQMSQNLKSKGELEQGELVGDPVYRLADDDGL